MSHTNLSLKKYTVGIQILNVPSIQMVKNYHEKKVKRRMDEIQTKTSKFWMVGTITTAKAKAQLFENQTIWNWTFKKSDFKYFQILNGQISDSHCMLDIHSNLNL